MRYRYTVRSGYDRLIKKKVEKGTLFAVPIAVMAIVGFAALTSNTTSGPGIGSGSKGTGGHSTVTTTFQPTASNQTAGSGSTGNSATSTQGGSVTASGTSSSGGTAQSLQPSSVSTSSGGSSGGSTGTSSGGSSGTTTIIPIVPLPITICTKDPLTNLCIN